MNDQEVIGRFAFFKNLFSSLRVSDSLSSMRFLACLSGPLIVVSILYACASDVADNQPLRAVPELISQQYCSGDAEVFAVNLGLGVKYTNQTEKALTLDNEIGKAWYGISVARNVEDLAAGNYGCNPNSDWQCTD